MIVDFGEYLPDLPDHENPGCVRTDNSTPVLTGYRPVKTLTASSNNALTARARGAVSASDTTGNVYNYAGDVGQLYSLANGTWSNVAKGGVTAHALGDDEVWEFAKFKNDKVIAVCGVNGATTNATQVITLGGSNFADLGGNAPQARRVGVVRDFVVVGNTWDSSANNMPNRVRWSAINNEASWTASAATQSDHQDLAGNGGEVVKIVGGEYGTIFQERSIWRMEYVGLPTVFQFDETLPGIGTRYPNSIAQLGDIIFCLANDGFRSVINGSSSETIGAEKVDRTVLADIDDTYRFRVVGAIDAINQYYLCGYPSSGATGGVADKIMVYHWPTRRWSGPISADVQTLFNALSAGTTLEGLDAVNASLDALPQSLDSRAWMGGILQLGAFDNTNSLAQFSGSNMTAIFETKEFSGDGEGHRLFVSRVRPLGHDGTNVTNILHRSSDLDSVTVSATATAETQGFHSHRVDNRLMAVRVTASGAWTERNSVDIELVKRGGFR